MAEVNMASSNYRRNNMGSSGVEWPLAILAISLSLSLVALPAMLLGYIAQRTISKYTKNEKLSIGIWLLLSLIGGAAFTYFYQHGLQQMVVNTATDYINTAKHYQTDFGRWNIKQLFTETWPIWIRTLTATPIAGFWFEISQNAIKPGQTLKGLKQKEQDRQRNISKAKRRAKKRTRRPERIPDAVHGMMVIGVPIEEHEMEEK
jgi:hypothetical protein